MAGREEAIFDVVDPFEDEVWCGWARFGRGMGAKWHRVWYAPRGPNGEHDTGYLPICRSRKDPMPADTVVMDYRWDPGRLDACERCWPAGCPHPGTISDLPPDKRYR